MSKTDAYIRVTCDTCGVEEEVEMNYAYDDYSGKNGCYVDPFKGDGKAHAEGIGDFHEIDEDTHICDDCKENQDDED